MRSPDRPIKPLYLGHGASGSAESMRVYVDALAEHGIRAHTVPASGKLPQPAERALPVFRSVVGEVGRAVIGGHSYGGRVASLLAAEATPAGLVLFSYPLHPPGRIDQLRTEHLSRITCPVLLLCGEGDPFEQPIDLLRRCIAEVPRAELVTYPRVGHGIHRDAMAFADAIERTAEFVKNL